MTSEQRVRLRKDIAYEKDVLKRMKSRGCRACETRRQENRIKQMEWRLQNG